MKNLIQRFLVTILISLLIVLLSRKADAQWIFIDHEELENGMFFISSPEPEIIWGVLLNESGFLSEQVSRSNDDGVTCNTNYASNSGYHITSITAIDEFKAWVTTLNSIDQVV